MITSDMRFDLPVKNHTRVGEVAHYGQTLPTASFEATPDQQREFTGQKERDSKPVRCDFLIGYIRRPVRSLPGLLLEE